MRSYAIMLFGLMTLLGFAYIPQFMRKVRSDSLNGTDGFIVGCLILGVMFFGISLSIGLI